MSRTLLLLSTALLCLALAPTPSSAAKPSINSKAGPAKSPKPTSSPLRSQNRQRQSKSGIGALEGASRPPSPELAARIQRQESGLDIGSVAVGAAGATLLYSMLSSNDLSSADRRWINDRLAEIARQEGEQEQQLLGRANSPLAFKFAGLKPSFEPGEEVTLSISAERDGLAVPVTCSVPGARFEADGKAALLRWRPVSPGVDLLTCDAQGVGTRRLLRVARGE